MLKQLPPQSNSGMSSFDNRNLRDTIPLRLNPPDLHNSFAHLIFQRLFNPCSHPPLTLCTLPLLPIQALVLPLLSF